MKNNRKKSILLLFIIIFLVNGCSDGLFNNLGQNGGSTRPTPGNPDNGGGIIPPTPDFPSGGGGSGGDNGTSGDSGGGSIIPPTPDFPSGGGDTGGGSTPPAGGVCDPSTVLKPIKRLLAGAGDGVIYYSEDNGNSWKKSQQPAGTTNFYWQSFADLGNDIVIAGSVDGLAGSLSGIGLLRSTDGGKTWNTTNITTGRWNDIFYAGNGVVIAGSYDNQGVWRSTDYGKTWKQNVQKDINKRNPPCWQPDGIATGDVSGFARLKDGRIIVGRPYTNDERLPDPISISDDEGLTWCKNPMGFPGYTPRAEFINQSIVLMDGTLVLATQWDKNFLSIRNRDGIPASGIDGQLNNWEFSLNNQYNFYSLAQLRNGVVLAGGARDNAKDNADLKYSGIWRSLDNASRGSFVQTKSEYQWRSIVGLDNCNAIATCYHLPTLAQCKASLYKSVDNGSSWNVIPVPLPIIFKLAIVR